ncbi:MAG: hypothetical protein D6770_09160 [Anaerolineae bacterium]|nr:MAG: hypothetical protein D6770_09160 [Anaerolineae bacterium]
MDILPLTCNTPQAQALIRRAAEDPTGLAQAWLTYWEAYFREHPDLLQASLFDPDWYRRPFEWPATTATTVDIGDLPIPTFGLNLPKMGTITIRFPALTLGLANIYEYPDLGVTVFTACALIYDTDLGTRPHSVEELESLSAEGSTGDVVDEPITRPDVENARPRWYLGEVAVAYAVHPDSWLNEVEPASGEFIFSTFGPGGSSGSQWVTLNVRIAPGCYYHLWPQSVRRAKGADPTCALLGDLAQSLSTYIGDTQLASHAMDLATTLTFTSPPPQQLADIATTYLIADLYALPHETMSGDEWKTAIQEILLDRAADAYDPTAPDAAVAQNKGVTSTLALVVLAWKDAQPDAGAPRCTAHRALLHYKLQPGDVTPLCAIEDILGSDYWIPLDETFLYDGNPFTLALEDWLTLATGEQD